MTSKKWIQNAINPARKGIEQRAAKRARMPVQTYMEEHASDKGAAGKRARLGLTLTKISRKRGR